jgi:hypothetical protein
MDNIYLILTSLLIIFLTILSKYVYRIVIKPLILVYQYKAQGIPSSYFHPIKGIFHLWSQSSKNFQNYLQGEVNILEKAEERPYALVSNIKYRPCIILYDTDLIREFYSKIRLYKKSALLTAPFERLMHGSIFSTYEENFKK